MKISYPDNELRQNEVIISFPFNVDVVICWKRKQNSWIFQQHTQQKFSNTPTKMLRKIPYNWRTDQAIVLNLTNNQLNISRTLKRDNMYTVERKFEKLLRQDPKHMFWTVCSPFWKRKEETGNDVITTARYSRAQLLLSMVML